MFLNGRKYFSIELIARVEYFTDLKEYNFRDGKGIVTSINQVHWFQGSDIVK